ncbi:hypothetical protein IWZ00DRAFT_490730 [Phyllosticta capitalensis]|uniref:uncharacterized protein n=1 Tax=Phyllosticta capitalensis TaxID=121624 RepID=UPI00312E326C
MASSGRLIAPDPLSLNPHHQRYRLDHPLSSFQVKSLRARLHREIAALRVSAAHKPLTSEENRSLYVKLSQLSNLDEHYPYETEPLPHRTGNQAQDTLQAYAALAVKNENTVGRREGKWSWVGEGRNPDFAYEGPYGPARRDYSPSERISPAATLVGGRSGRTHYARLAEPQREHRSNHNHHDYYNTEAPRYHTNVAEPHHHRQRRSPNRNAAPALRYLYGSSGSEPVRERRSGNNHQYNIVEPRYHDYERDYPAPHRRAHRVKRNAKWVANERDSTCIVM